MHKKISLGLIAWVTISSSLIMQAQEKLVVYGMSSAQVVALLDAYMKGGLRATPDGYLRYKNHTDSRKNYVSSPGDVQRVLQDIEREPFNSESYEDSDPRVCLRAKRLTYQWFCKGIDLEGNRKPLGSAVEKSTIARIKNNRLVLIKAVESGDAKKIGDASKKTLHINEPRLVRQSWLEEVMNRFKKK